MVMKATDKLVHFLEQELGISSGAISLALRHCEQTPQLSGYDPLAVWTGNTGSVSPNFRLVGNSISCCFNYLDGK